MTTATEYVIVKKKSRGAAIVAGAVAVMTVGSLIAGPQLGTLASFTAAASVKDAKVEAGNLSVGFVDPSGNLTTASTTIVTNAVPDMAAKTSTFTVKNSGSVYSQISLKTADLNTFATASLDNVLVLEVKNAAGTSIYKGKVSGFTYTDSTEYAAGESRVFTYTLTWPSTANDNTYQNAKIAFTTTADAISTGRQ